jgi:hypothetical protein
VRPVYGAMPIHKPKILRPGVVSNPIALCFAVVHVMRVAMSTWEHRATAMQQVQPVQQGSASTVLHRTLSSIQFFRAVVERRLA